MGIAGSIKEIGIADLIQQNCLDRKKSKLTIKYMDRQAILYFNDGSVVDAIMGDISGEEVIYKILEWEDGTFLIEKNVEAPRRTIKNTWAGLILEGGLVASDVFTTADGQSLAGYNSNPKACALFNEITKYLHKSLKGSGFPGLGGYYLVHLENNMVVVVISHGEVQNGMLVDLSKTTMGLLLNVALPKAIATEEEAMK
jgi:hypothetical protein